MGTLFVLQTYCAPFMGTLFASETCCASFPAWAPLITHRSRFKSVVIDYASLTHSLCYERTRTDNGAMAKKWVEGRERDWIPRCPLISQPRRIMTSPPSCFSPPLILLHIFCLGSKGGHVQDLIGCLFSPAFYRQRGIYVSQLLKRHEFYMWPYLEL